MTSCALLVMTVVLFSHCGVFATAKESNPSKVSWGNVDADRSVSDHYNIKGGRQLRIAGGSRDNEDRGITSWFKNWAQVRRWVKAEEANDVVMKELGLTGLTGTALTSHPNYKRLEKFRPKAERKWVMKLIYDGYSPTTYWNKLNLENLPTTEPKTSEEFNRYLRYATRYDDEIYRNLYSLTRPTPNFGGTRAEMFVKVGIWAKANRPRDYVRTFLNLETSSPSLRKENEFYQEFLELTKKLHNNRV